MNKREKNRVNVAHFRDNDGNPRSREREYERTNELRRKQREDRDEEKLQLERRQQRIVEAEKEKKGPITASTKIKWTPEKITIREAERICFPNGRRSLNSRILDRRNWKWNNVEEDVDVEQPGTSNAGQLQSLQPIDQNRHIFYRVNLPGIQKSLNFKLQGNEVEIRGEQRVANFITPFIHRVFVPEGIQKNAIYSNLDSEDWLTLTGEKDTTDPNNNFPLGPSADDHDYGQGKLTSGPSAPSEHEDPFDPISPTNELNLHAPYSPNHPIDLHLPENKKSIDEDFQAYDLCAPSTSYYDLDP